MSPHSPYQIRTLGGAHAWRIIFQLAEAPATVPIDVRGEGEPSCGRYGAGNWR